MGNRQSTAVVPKVLLVPTLGFTSEGARLGYGGGYYDRTLAALHAQGIPFTTIGIAWDQAELDEEAQHVVQAHDYPLDAVLTPSGWHGSMPEIKKDSE
jgi:5,10-methenyltetrahydrofolate synthetase